MTEKRDRRDGQEIPASAEGPTVTTAFKGYSPDDKSALNDLHEEMKKSVGMDVSRHALIRALEPDLVTPSHLINR